MSSFSEFCGTALKSKLDRGSPCLVPFLISNMLLSSSVSTDAFWSLKIFSRSLMWSCLIPQDLRAFQIDMCVMSRKPLWPIAPQHFNERSKSIIFLEPSSSRDIVSLWLFVCCTTLRNNGYLVLDFSQRQCVVKQTGCKS